MKPMLGTFLLTAFLLLTLSFQCGDDDWGEYVYELELPLTVSPVQKEYHINDTIEISLLIRQDSLLDLDTRELVPIRCASMPIRYYLGVRFANNSRLDEADLFEIIADSANCPQHYIENNGQYSYFEADVAEERLSLEEIPVMKIIPRKAGVFMMNPYHLDYIPITRRDSCDQRFSSYEVGKLNHLFEVEDTNPELMSPLPNRVFVSGDLIPMLTEDKRIFWFKVIE